MQTDSNLRFIREKIYQIRSALMYSMSNELIKIPNNIVTVLRVDEDGQLWFLSQRPLQQVEQCEQSFPVRLFFYRKGVSFFLEVNGKATIVKDEYNSLFPFIAESETGRPILMKMNINNLEFTEQGEKKKKNRLELIMENSYKWLLHTIAFSRSEKSVLHKLHGVN
jgi:Pyridoxamine 5'-phosphate oxidase like